jgi:hypothetical protein
VPTISIFFGIVVQMYWNDHNPPHFHAYYQGHRVLVAIGDGKVIGGTMPPGALRVLREWTLRHRDELMANWERARLQQALQTIPGADQE